MRFFNEEGYKALPGYTGRDKQHVLRVRGFHDDRELQHLLQDVFPQWQKEERAENGGVQAPAVRIADDLDFLPLEESAPLNQAPVEHWLGEHSTDLAALAYAAGNVGLAFSALSGHKPEQGASGGSGGREWAKMAAPVSYTLSSALLLALNRNRPDPRSIHDILDDIGPFMEQHGMMKHGSPAQAVREGREDIAHQAMDFLTRHPWEVSSILNMVGAGSHAVSSFTNRRHVEGLAAMGTLTAMAIAAFVPEKGGRSLLDFSEAFRRPDGSTVLEPLHLMAQEAPLIRPIYEQGVRASEWIQEKPLRASAAVQFMGNAGYAASALMSRDAAGRRCVDRGLLATSGAYITGNVFQSLASKGQGPGFDDVVTAAAAYIEDRENWSMQDRLALRRQIVDLAHALADQPEIVHSEERLQRGIEARLSRFTEGFAADKPQDYLESFIPGERLVLRESPFISPKVMARVMPEAQEGGMAR